LSTPLLTIQKAAEKVGVTPNTLRIYERLGLIAPARNSAGQRVFSTSDVAKAKKFAAQRRAKRGSGLRNATIYA
jgi:MerR family transcriptional regulator/heat shock protein HspR